MAEGGVQFVGAQFEYVVEVAEGKMARRDAALSGQDGSQDQLRPPAQAPHRGRLPADFPALPLGQKVIGHGGGERLEVHGDRVAGQCVS